jgi:hypothetical protein
MSQCCCCCWCRCDCHDCDGVSMDSSIVVVAGDGWASEEEEEQEEEEELGSEWVSEFPKRERLYMKDMEIGQRFQGACEIYPDKNWLLFFPFLGGGRVFLVFFINTLTPTLFPHSSSWCPSLFCLLFLWFFLKKRKKQSWAGST